MANNRFVTNTVSELQEVNRSSIFDYEGAPLLTLEEAISKIILPMPDITKHVQIALEKSNRESSLLTRNESAAIYMYTMPSSISSPLNEILRVTDRNGLKAWLAFIKLLMTALKKLPSEKATVWRGVNFHDTLTYVDDEVHIWWSFNSCSINPNSLQPYLSEGGTLFAIDAVHAKDISAFSAIPDEQEVILMPGARVRRRHDSLSFVDRLFILHLEEISFQK